jgi:ParB-like chromosome segregation protein Spo0J
VFDTEEGLLLADGYHRVAAALKEGRKTVEAEVRRGSRHDALE